MKRTIRRYCLTLLIIMAFTGCTDVVTDNFTEEKLKVIEKTDPRLTKIKVRTDGMLSDTGYESWHPFGLNNEVLADMEYYESHDVSRGDIVVFKTKNDASQDTDIARVVGLPGETVRIQKGQVYIDEKKLDTFYGDDSTGDNNDSWDPVTLKENEYYILADVRWRGFHDSQTSGPFRKEDILGKIVGYEK